MRGNPTFSSLKEYPFFLGTTEGTEGTPGKEEIGNLGAG
jgi:hypothetical protein